jgi:hypothetical protein
MRFHTWFLMSCTLTWAADVPPSPLRAVLEQFAAPGIPALGPSEAGPSPRRFPSALAGDWPSTPCCMPAKVTTRSSW